MSKRTYWHFVNENKRLGYGDNRLVEVGKTYKCDGAPVLCQRGMHASRRLIDALEYAPGPILCKVQLSGTVIHDVDKSVATDRTVIAMADVSDILRSFARKRALDVVHLWDAPDIVVRYLETGDESIRDAARDAAWTAARAAARAAAWTAARAATWTAARDAARDAAWAAARAAAWDATWTAARDAAWATAWTATRDAARDAQNRRLAAMVRKADWESVA